MTEPEKNERRSAPRREIEPDEAELSFIVEEDDLHVSDVTISKTGIGFATKRPLRVNLKLRWKDREESKNATLVWVRREDKGGMHYGFTFEE